MTFEEESTFVSIAELSGVATDVTAKSFNPLAPSDYLFNERVDRVRNEVCNLGWVGNSLTPLSPDGGTALSFKPIAVGVGDNVIGDWQIMVVDEGSDRWLTIGSVRDDLRMDCDALALEINTFAGACIESHHASLDEAYEIGRVKATCDVIDPWKTASYLGNILGVTDKHVVQSAGRTASIFSKRDLDCIPEAGQIVHIGFCAGKGVVAVRELGPGFER